jgi:hypothetical protein
LLQILVGEARAGICREIMRGGLHRYERGAPIGGTVVISASTSATWRTSTGRP